MPSSDQIIRASEIGEYVFCRRAWWLHRVQGLESVNRAQMETSAARHYVQHSRAVQRADALTRAAIILGVVALFISIRQV